MVVTVFMLAVMVVIVMMMVLMPAVAVAVAIGEPVGMVIRQSIQLQSKAYV